MESSSGGYSASSVMSKISCKRKAETADTSSSPDKKLKLCDSSQSTFEPAHADGSDESSRRPTGLSIKQLGGVAASVLGISRTASSGSQATKAQKEEFMDLPHAVLQMTATGLQCDLIVAGLLQSQGLLETVLCVPRDLISVSLRLSKGLLAKNTCEVRQSRLFTAA